MSLIRHLLSRAWLAALLCSTAWAAEPPPAHGMPAAKPKRPPAVSVKPVDINSAAQKDLLTLPGIGNAEARHIIACRPYLTKADLVTKKVLPIGPYLSLKDRVVAVQRSRPKAPSQAVAMAGKPACG